MTDMGKPEANDCEHKFVADDEITGFFTCSECGYEIVHACFHENFMPWLGDSCEACELGLPTTQ